MKKLFAIIIAITFCAGFVFAQNTDSTSQTGNSNIANTTQTGHNDAYTTRVGDINKATVTQIGTNYGEIDQLNNAYKNVATLSQNGSGNEGWINQGMTAGFWSDYQTVGAKWNKATMTQTGNSNQGSLEQYGGSNSTNGNVANLTQDGNGNTAYGYQGWAYSGWGETYTTSHLQSFNSKVNISQIHNNNYAAVWQYGGNGNNASISQDGNNNSSSIVQGSIYNDAPYSFSHPVINTVNNYAKVAQTGDNNHGKVMQLGDNNSFKLSQGNGSSVGYDVTQTGLLLGRNAYFQQDGDNNKFTGEQINGAKLDAASEGITGYYGSFQKGNGNTINLRQYNDNALMQQMGNSNTATLWQGGTAVHNATILQNGNSNSVNVHQQ